MSHKRPFSRGPVRAVLLGLAALSLGPGCEDPLPPSSPSLEEACLSTAALDVLPGTYPNAIDLSAPGTLEAVVLGSEALDARTLDPATALLEDPDTAGKTVAAEGPLEERDVDGDGRLDGVLRFSVPALVNAGVLHGEVSRLKLTVKTQTGTEVSGCDRAHAAGHLLARLPAPTGPHAVGTTAYHWKDSARPETFTNAQDDLRELMVRVWYPAESRPGAQPAPYFLQRREGVANAERFGSPERLFDFVHAHAVAEAPLARAEARYPVLLFSPGLGVPPSLYASFLEELASHGYVVVAPSHTYSSGAVVFPEGRVAPNTQEPSPFNGSQTAALLGVWTADARFVLAQLEGLDREDPLQRLTGRLDLERLGMLGHSLGGANAAAVCQQEPRMKVCANLDGTFWGDSQQGVSDPFLLMTAGDVLDGSQETFTRQMRGGGYHAGLERAGHGTYTDLPLLLELLKHAQSRIDDTTFETGQLGARGTELIRAYTRAFFDKHLRGGDAPLLDGASPAPPEVTLTVYRP